MQRNCDIYLFYERIHLLISDTKLVIYNIKFLSYDGFFFGIVVTNKCIIYTNEGIYR